MVEGLGGSLVQRFSSASARFVISVGGNFWVHTGVSSYHILFSALLAVLSTLI